MRRWLIVLGLLLVVVPSVLFAMAAGGATSERRLIEASEYVVLPIGAGLGVLLLALWNTRKERVGSIVSALLLMIAAGAGGAYLARALFFAYLWRHL
jgi:hypothetical protein